MITLVVPEWFLFAGLAYMVVRVVQETRRFRIMRTTTKKMVELEEKRNE